MTDKVAGQPPGNVISFSAIAKSQAGGEVGWLAECQYENGKPINNLANVLIALRFDPALCDAVALDEMLQRPFLMKPLPGDGIRDNSYPAR